MLRPAPVAVPLEDEPPLLADADRMELCQLAAQFFEVVTRWHSQVCISRCVVDHLDLAEQTAFDISGDFLRSDIVDKELAQPVISKAQDHSTDSSELMYYSTVHSTNSVVNGKT